MQPAPIAPSRRHEAHGPARRRRSCAAAEEELGRSRYILQQLQIELAELHNSGVELHAAAANEEATRLKMVESGVSVELGKSPVDMGMLAIAFEETRRNAERVWRNVA